MKKTIKRIDLKAAYDRIIEILDEDLDNTKLSPEDRAARLANATLRLNAATQLAGAQIARNNSHMSNRLNAIQQLGNIKEVRALEAGDDGE